MPFCPNCRTEFPLGQIKCPDCEVELVEVLPAPPEEETDLSDKSVLLCKTADMTGAELLAETFREENIPFIMNPGSVSFRIMPLEYGQKSIRFFTLESDLERASQIAERILNDFGEGQDELTEEDEPKESDDEK